MSTETINQCPICVAPCTLYGSDTVSCTKCLYMAGRVGHRLLCQSVYFAHQSERLTRSAYYAQEQLRTAAQRKEIRNMQASIVRLKATVRNLREKLDRRNIPGWREVEGYGLRPHYGYINEDGVPVLKWYFPSLSFKFFVHAPDKVRVSIEEVAIESRSRTEHLFEFASLADAAYSLKEQLKKEGRP